MQTSMMIRLLSSLLIAISLIFSACEQKPGEQSASNAPADFTEDFTYKADRFADVQVIRYQIPGFNALSLQQKKLLYYLSQAALSGRDIMWDQNYKYNLYVRRSLEAIWQNYKGDRNTADFKHFEEYAKEVWFSNGIHHHYSNAKIIPAFKKEYLAELLKNTSGLPLAEGQTVDQFIAFLSPIVMDPKVAPKKVDKSPNTDIVRSSAVNFYEGVSQKEAEAFYAAMSKAAPDPAHAPEFGLNTKLVKANGKIEERVWKVGGMYSQAIEKIVFWLEKAKTVAENDKQRVVIENLIKFYQTGDLRDFVNYNIAWVADTASRIDFVNGFIEVYNDPIGFKGSFESVVNMKDMEASRRIAAIAKEAKYFEQNSPILPQHKKPDVKGISAKVITVVQESGDAAPSTPIGINLPNSNWIRVRHGSKSVNLGNIVRAYDEAGKGGGVLREFYLPGIADSLAKYGAIADNLHTDMHEVIGHASGQLEEGVPNGPESLKNYYNTLEEARADLVALYYIADQKLVDMGVMPNLQVGRSEYDRYIANGMMVQLTRLKPGDDVEEAHMRNRQLVAKWVFEKGKADNVIEMRNVDGKTYFVINDYAKLRTLFGDLLREIQRIKSQGDFEAGKKLVEGYGVKVDQAIHREVLARYEKLNVAPYKGFIQPRLVPVEENGEIVDIHLEYPADFVQQMLWYGKDYSFLPNQN